MRFLILASICVALSVACILEQDKSNEYRSGPRVKTPLGEMRGSTLKSKDKRTIYTFRGVRYAEPPVGSLRFQPPVPVKKWEGLYDASKDPPGCPQPESWPTEEDCLFLNVYTTKFRCHDETALKPVMVFFHPGSFYGGSCKSSLYGPQYLLDKDVVLVVPNYRLGSLGFLSTGTKEAPGNNGMKDQVAVLRWVKDNIVSFGGNPDKVTIFGYCAGGLSVTAHLLSPLSRGLFHRAIAMSGSIVGNIPIYTNQSDLAKKQARVLNCSEATPAELISCLKTKSADQLANSLLSFNEILTDPVWLWTPVIEPDFGQERFLTEHPIHSIEKGDIADVPIMLGVTTDEFGSKAVVIMENARILEAYDRQYTKVWPIIYMYDRNLPSSENISNTFRKLYFPNGVDNSTIQGIGDMYADAVTGFSVNRAAKLLSKNNSQNVYYYLFNYHGKYSHVYYSNTNNTVPYGVSLNDDLLYLFYIPRTTPLFTSGPEAGIVEDMTNLWTNFAKTGNPIPKQTEEDQSVLGSISWPPFDEKKQSYMEIDLKLKVKEKLYNDRYAVWEKIYPLSAHDHSKN